MAICKDESAREKLHQILDLVIDINDLEARNKRETGDKPTAWFEFNGHVNWINVRVDKFGWKPGSKRTINEDAKCLSHYELDHVIGLLKQAKEVLGIE